MLGADISLNEASNENNKLFSLVFGSEASGLGGEFKSIGRPVRIPQRADIDSYNIAVAVGVGAYAFSSTHGLI
jgi:TrmH family RNA methyltransferase